MDRAFDSNADNGCAGAVGSLDGSVRPQDCPHQRKPSSVPEQDAEDDCASSSHAEIGSECAPHVDETQSIVAEEEVEDMMAMAHDESTSPLPASPGPAEVSSSRSGSPTSFVSSSAPSPFCSLALSSVSSATASSSSSSSLSSSSPSSSTISLSSTTAASLLAAAASPSAAVASFLASAPAPDTHAFGISRMAAPVPMHHAPAFAAAMDTSVDREDNVSEASEGCEEEAMEDTETFINVSIRHPMSQEPVTVSCSTTDTVQDLVDAIADQAGYAANAFRMVVGSRELLPDSHLSDYGLCEGSTVNLVPRLATGHQLRNSYDMFGSRYSQSGNGNSSSSSSSNSSSNGSGRQGNDGSNNNGDLSAFAGRIVLPPGFCLVLVPCERTGMKRPMLIPQHVAAVLRKDMQRRKRKQEQRRARRHAREASAAAEAAAAAASAAESEPSHTDVKLQLKTATKMQQVLELLKAQKDRRKASLVASNARK